jgi:hypothetical protein
MIAFYVGLRKTPSSHDRKSIGAGEKASVPLGIILVFEVSSATFSPGR